VKAEITIGVIKTDGYHLAGCKIGGKEFMGQPASTPGAAIYSLLTDLGGGSGRFIAQSVKTAIDLMIQGTTFDAVIPASHFDPNGKDSEHHTGDKK
jgi:hypothetical protein